jgi:membrane-bound lytic murein transglycosylase D
MHPFRALSLAVAAGCVLGVGTASLKRSALATPAPGHAYGVGIAESPSEPSATWDIPLSRNESVERFVRMFGEKQTDRMALYLKRSGRYEGMIRTKLRARGMPEDLIYLSMIESGFNPTARSPAAAVGLWQFIPDTGRRYGLRIDEYVDERRDPERSTDAALRHLQDLHRRFGSWYLAAAAYNSGAGRVSRAMLEITGAERGREDDFWRVRHRLPRETRDYVPLIVAAALVGKEPHKYGLEEVERWMPLPTQSVPVPGGVDLAVVARAVGVSEQEMRRLNPQLLRGMTPPGAPYPLRIPAGRGELLAANFERARAEQRARMAAATDSARRLHIVRRGESLSLIARRHGTSVAALQRANQLGQRTVIQPGQNLRIPAL